MKKFLAIVFLLFISNLAFASDEDFRNIITEDSLVVYSIQDSSWSTVIQNEDDLILKKNLADGLGSCSLYRYEDNTLAFALSANIEFIHNGKFIVVDNNLLKYYKVIYADGRFEQIPLTSEEIQEVFPQAELLKMSEIDTDNKMWIHKPLLKDRIILLVNDTDKFFHQITCKSKNIQDKDIKALITISRYGIIRFTHYGERNGKLTFYVR